MTNGFARQVLVACIACVAALIATAGLERQRAGLTVERLTLAGSPATVWRNDAAGQAPLVVIAHGYAGSQQMMQSIALSLARAGMVAVTFDFMGHGRHDRPMSGDIESLDGATARLVAQTISVTRVARELPGVSGPVALVGHSMATDIVIRAAERIEGVAAVVAISMYSDAVRAGFPERLLIVSGEWEGRLRDVALDRLRQVDPAAMEGKTVASGDVTRRAVTAHFVGHVGVLYSHTTLSEIRNWILPATGRMRPGPVVTAGPWLALLLAAIVALAWPLAGLLARPRPAEEMGRRHAALAVVAPVLPALGAAYLLPHSAFGVSAFGALTAFFATWGAVQLAVVWAAGWRPSSVSLPGFALLLAWGLGLFAFALDRYGASFVPTGPRMPLAALLLIGTLPFCLGDAVIARAGWMAWLAARLLPLVVLFAAMLLQPRLGVAYTVLPVLGLFWCVYGLVGGWVRSRIGATTSGLALGIILAWALAASTPLIAA